MGFSILVFLLDKLFLEIDLDLATVFTVFYGSVLRVHLDLSNDLSLSYLLLLGVSTVLLDDFDIYVLLTVSIFFSAIGGVMASFTTFGFVFLFLSTMSAFPSLTTIPVVVTNAF